MSQPLPQPVYLTLKEVCGLLRVGRTTIWRYHRRGVFPHPVRLNARGDLAWTEAAIRGWLAQRDRGEIDFSGKSKLAPAQLLNSTDSAPKPGVNFGVQTGVSQASNRPNPNATESTRMEARRPRQAPDGTTLTPQAGNALNPTEGD